MRCDVLAIGTELLLGQIVDTNSSWIGEQLAAAGIDTCEHRKVGDNLDRMVQCLRELLDQADAVIVCGGLGPTPDDVTREAIAEVMGVELERREELIEHIRASSVVAAARCPRTTCARPTSRSVAASSRTRSAPRPGCSCPRSNGKVVYTVPGVPYEMRRWSTSTCSPICSSVGRARGDRGRAR